MRLELLDYDLPPELVAQVPAPRREDARLLVLDRAHGARTHLGVRDLPALLRPGDLLVTNDTRVLFARVDARRGTGGRAEVLFLEPREDGTWEALVRAGGSLAPGEALDVVAPAGDSGGRVRLEACRGGGAWAVRVLGEEAPALMARLGRMPLPPYIRRADDDPRHGLDRERYQTTFARVPGAVAAPTAGLHLSSELLEAIAARGVARATVTLHVGLGTFEPVRADDLDDHVMHEERYEIPAATAQAVRETRQRGSRVVAVGTTVVRALEASALGAGGRLPAPGAGRTSLLIAPGFDFRVVDALLTNFHLPRSTLLALVAAFAGRPHVLEAYREAVRLRYRFYSYGDAMLIA